MAEEKSEFPYIRCLTPEDEQRIKKIPFLNIDTVLIPSPYVKDKEIDKDYLHSYVWDEEGEILGYLVVYANKEQSRFHIYTQVTSPFGRGKGIGSAFVEKLAAEVPAESTIYLYVWEKLGSVVNFYAARAFEYTETTVYRKMTFSLLEGQAQTISKRMERLRGKDFSLAEQLSRVRHDARKSLKVLLDMIGVISADNFHKVVEDVNRETTALLNTLNVYEDKISNMHKVDIKELVQERVIPVIEAAEVACDIRLTLGGNVPEVTGNYINYSRALINIVSNALDAIRSAERRGLIDIILRPDGDKVMLIIEDNGIGIEAERLLKAEGGLPLFVGKTSKQLEAGEGVGTRQIFSTFGQNNIEVESEPGRFTRWSITLRRSTRGRSNLMAVLESRYISLFKISQRVALTERSTRTQVAVFIWQLRQMEILSYDLISQFSRYNNVRDIYRSVLLYRYGGKNWQFLRQELDTCRIDNQIIKIWLATILKRIKRNETFLDKKFDFEAFKGMLFKSYGQSIDYHIIFTIDPVSGRFFSCERKLAEHMDFVPYLGKERDDLLRGEFIGDVKNLESPIVVGVWTVTSMPDMRRKLRLIRQVSRQFLEMGLKEEKRLSFYNTTYNSSDWEIDTLKTTTLGEMANLSEERLEEFIVEADDEFSGLACVD
jgi:GNAT superfamily N-acetyltransferase/two-component sensor histidine kinase